MAASKDERGCFVTRSYDRPGQTTLLLGLDIDGSNRLSVLNDNWSIKPKDRLSLTYRLSGSAFPKHFSVGILSGEKRGFATSFGAEFPASFATSDYLHIFRGKVPVEKLDLVGSGAAVGELRRCVAVFKGRPSPARASEKSRPDGIPADPFAPDSKGRARK